MNRVLLLAVSILGVVVSIIGFAFPTTSLGAQIITAIALAMIVVIAARSKTHSAGTQAALTMVSNESVGDESAARALDELREAIHRELKERSERIDARERELDEKLVAFREWIEYPVSVARQNDSTDTIPNSTALEASSSAQLAEKDQQVLELLEAQAKEVYEKIKSGYYKVADGDGKRFDLEKARVDIVTLATSVARVYQPDSENPLLETSTSDILRAASRVCLHLLIVLERLPLGLEDKTLSAIYGYVQKAVKAYDIYQSASPYLGFAARAFNVGRFAAGANPLSLGITWGLSEIGKFGAKQLTAKLVDDQAIGALHDLIRVVGFEVAGIYSSGFRHRDLNWVFGSELTELMSQFPISRESLSRSLREVSGLRLRNEYDRVFLYRCLSTHRSAGPQDAISVLTTEECQQVAKQLAQFHDAFMFGRTSRRVEKWRTGVEQRLGVKLAVRTDSVDSTAGDATHSDQFSVIESLVGFLVGIKSLTVDEAVATIQSCEGCRGIISQLELESSTADSVFENIKASPPLAFDPPDIEVQSKLVSDYMTQLIHLAIRTRPWDLPVDDIVMEIGAYFQIDLERTRKLLDDAYVEFAASTMQENAAVKKISPGTIRASMASIPYGNAIRFAYPDARLAKPVQDAVAGTLIGTDDHLLLVLDGESFSTVLMASLGSTRVERVDSELSVFSAEWQVVETDESFSMALTLSKPMLNFLTSFESWFAAILEAVG